MSPRCDVTGFGADPDNNNGFLILANIGFSGNPPRWIGSCVPKQRSGRHICMVAETGVAC